MPQHPRPSRTWFAAATSAALAAGIAVVVNVAGQAPAQAATRATVLKSAAAYAKSHGYKVGISVYDTKLHRLYSAGSHKGAFATESVVKVFIAARLIHQGRLHGKTKKRAFKMITQSDDAIASSFYGSVGGDNLIKWVKHHYHVPDLGSRPIRSNWWGSTRINSDGLVKLYAKLKKDKKVSYWLRHTMRQHTKYGSDGFNQSFGLPKAAAGNEAVKQGWGSDYSYSKSNASENSTGFVNGDRYAVAILARGPGSTYGSRIGAAITHIAKMILPGGYFPAAYPQISTVSDRTLSSAGGQAVTLTGVNFTKVSRVIVGGRNARFAVRSSSRITLTTPPTSSGRHSFRVVTNHGTSQKAWATFAPSPAVAAARSADAQAAGGQPLTITGTNLGGVDRVVFGSPDNYRSARIVSVSPTRIRIVAPAYGAGSAPMHVGNAYGVSKTVRYTFVTPKTTSGDGAGTTAPDRSSTPSGPAGRMTPAPPGSTGDR